MKKVGNSVVLACLAGVLVLTAVLEAVERAQLETTDQVQAALKKQMSAWLGELKDLDAVTKAKKTLFDEATNLHKQDPSARNWLNLFVVLTSIGKDEASMISGLVRGTREMALTLEDERQRKESFAHEKKRALDEQVTKLEQLRKEWQDVSQQLKSEGLPDGQRRDLERRQRELHVRVEGGLMRKLQLEKSVQRAEAVLGRMAKDAEALGLLASGLKERRQKALARLESVREVLERGAVLGPDPEFETSKEGLGSMLSVARELSVSLDGYAQLPEREGQDAGLTDLQDAVRKYLAESGGPDSSQK